MINRHRKYEIQTIDAAIYDRSKLVSSTYTRPLNASANDNYEFFSRYRALSVMEDLIALDNGTHPPESGGTAISDRTPEWFADLYLKYKAYSNSARHRRFAYTSSDSDIEPKAEVLSLFATHAEWLYKHHRRRKEQRLNEEAWVKWIHQVKIARRNAAAEGISWGVWDNDQLEAMDEELLAPRPPPQKGRKRARASPEGAQRPPKSSNLSLSRRPGPSLTGRQLRSTTVRTSRPELTNLRTYDSDFSPESTPPASPSTDASLPSRPPTPPDPEIMKLFPVEFWHPPLLPLNYRWICPVVDCQYMVNLQDLSQDNCAALSANDVERLKAGGWVLREPWVQRCFKTMVSVHYEAHVDRAGVKIWQEGRTWRIGWKKPQYHAPWPPRRDLPKNLKVEEEEQQSTSSSEGE